jgi:hypothetical protein
LNAVSAPCAGCGGAVEVGRVLHVRSERDLSRLSRTWNRYDRIRLVTDQLDADERGRWEERLLSAYANCGCDAGGVAVLLALVGLVVVAIAVPGARTWTAVGLGVATTVAAALIGKVVGVAIARLRLRRDIRRVSVRLAATRPSA